MFTHIKFRNDGPCGLIKELTLWQMHLEDTVDSHWQDHVWKSECYVFPAPVQVSKSYVPKLQSALAVGKLALCNFAHRCVSACVCGGGNRHLVGGASFVLLRLCWVRERPERRSYRKWVGRWRWAYFFLAFKWSTKFSGILGNEESQWLVSGMMLCTWLIRALRQHEDHSLMSYLRQVQDR